MALLDDVLRAFGTNRTRMQWKVRAWRRGWDRRIAALGNRSRVLTYQHKTCPRCGHPAGADERRCTNCREPLGGMLAYRAQRLGAMLWIPGLPVVTTLVGLAIGAVYVATLLWHRDPSASVMGVIAGLSPSNAALDRFGALYTPAVAAGEWWRLVTSAYLHAGLLHLGFNIISLASVGSYLEALFGKLKTFALYTALALISAGVSYAWHTGTGDHVGNSVGASGAICGLIGIAIGFASRRRNAERHALGRYVMWAAWIGVIGMSGWRIDNAGHVGGLVPGLLIGLVVRRRADTGAAARTAWAIGALAALALTIAAFVCDAL